MLADVERYLADTLGKPPQPQLSRTVQAKTAGNPRFLREAVRLVTDHRARGQVLALEEMPLPEAAKGSLGHSLATLDPTTREVLEAACVIGEEFELSVLQKATGHSTDQLRVCLDLARCAGIVASRPDLQRQRFTHALMREVLYHAMPAPDCVRLHGRIGLALESLTSVEPRLDELAYHFHSALPQDYYERSMRYARLAGEAAMRAFAYEKAGKFYGWALAAQPHVPTDPRAAGQLLLASAAALQHAGKYDESRERCEQAIELARKHAIAEILVDAARVLRQPMPFLQQPDPLAIAALEDALVLLPESAKHTRAQAYCQIAYLPPCSSSIEESGRVSKLAVGLAREVGDRQVLLETLCSRLRALSGPDSLDALLAVADEVQRLEHRSSSSCGAEAELARHNALLLCGDVAGAERALDAFGRIARKLRLDTLNWHHERLCAQARLHAGDFDHAETLFAQLWLRGQQINLPYADGFYRLQLSVLSLERTGRPLARSIGPGAVSGATTRSAANPSQRVHAILVAIENGEIGPAHADFEMLCQDSYAAVTRDSSCLYTLARLAHGAIALGHRHAAAELYTLLRRYATFNAINSAGFTFGSVAHFLGKLARFQRDAAAAEAHFENALALNTRRGYRPHALRSQLALASLLAESSCKASRDRAHALATEVSTTASSLGMAGLVHQANMLMDDCCARDLLDIVAL